MATAIPAGFSGLYSDEVYSATDLNRRAAEVLNQARSGPVTISRNNEHFALMKREEVGKLIRAVTHLGRSVELVRAALGAREGGKAPPAFAWLSAFDEEDLRALVSEVLEASESALSNGDWKQVEALIHEWQESALVSNSGVLDEALGSEKDEVDLLDPRGAMLETDPGTACAE